jgi:2-methylcitrate dehydratase PrpD
VDSFCSYRRSPLRVGKGIGSGDEVAAAAAAGIIGQGIRGSIEVAVSLEAINAASSRQTRIWHEHTAKTVDSCQLAQPVRSG